MPCHAVILASTGQAMTMGDEYGSTATAPPGAVDPQIGNRGQATSDRIGRADDFAPDAARAVTRMTTLAKTHDATRSRAASPKLAQAPGEAGGDATGITDKLLRQLVSAPIGSGNADGDRFDTGPRAHDGSCLA